MRRTLGWVGRVIPNPPLSVYNPSDRRVKDNAPYPADATLLAFTVALLWTLHPLQTEAVTYIIQRTESLMGLFFLLTFYCFSRAASSPRPWPWRVLTVLACLGGVGAKEVGTTAPLLVFLYDRTFVAGTFGVAPPALAAFESCRHLGAAGAAGGQHGMESRRRRRLQRGRFAEPV